MKINAKKCFSLSLETVLKEGNIICDVRNKFNINGTDIKPTTHESYFKYLGIKFDPRGKTALTVVELNEILDRVLKSPLKPQQKLILVRDHVLPKISHRLVLGRFSKGLLDKLDLEVRRCLKTALHLPTDTPTANFYLKTKHGGLNITRLRESIPLSTSKRLHNMRQSDDVILSTVATSEDSEKLMKKCVSILNVSDERATSTKERLYDRTKQAWLSTVDGSDMGDAFVHEKSFSWAGGYSPLTSGRQFVTFTKLKLARLETRENCNRGRDVEKTCRGCIAEHVSNPRVETLNHVLTACPWTQRLRIKRHDDIVQHILKKAMEKGWKTINEPRYTTDEGLRKPDLLCYNDEKSCLVEVTIVGERSRFDGRTVGINEHFEEKYLKYNKEQIKTETFIKTGSIPEIFPIVFSVRGLWHNRNNEALKFLGISGAKTVLELKAMEGSGKTWTVFCKGT